MTRKYFGTDGIRGEVGQFPIVPDFVKRLGYAAGQVLAKSDDAHGKATVLIGKDTRVSGYLLEAALEAGLLFLHRTILIKTTVLNSSQLMAINYQMMLKDKLKRL